MKVLRTVVNHEKSLHVKALRTVVDHGISLRVRALRTGWSREIDPSEGAEECG